MMTDGYSIIDTLKNGYNHNGIKCFEIQFWINFTNDIKMYSDRVYMNTMKTTFLFSK